jgi:hypothetical protein
MSGFFKFTQLIYVIMAQRETGLLQQLIGFTWIALLCLSAGFCITEMKQPAFLLIAGEFLVCTGLLGTGIPAVTILLQTVPLLYIQSRTQ